MSSPHLNENNLSVTGDDAGESGRFLNLSADSGGQFTITTRQQPEAELIAVKQESDVALEVKDLLFKDIMNLSEAEEDSTVPSLEKLRCNSCHFTSTDVERMLRHERKVHRGLNPFQCYMCDYNTYNKVVFEEHVRIHRGIKPFKCAYCDYRSASKKNTKKHELIHRPDNPLRCRRCSFIARHQKALVCHMRFRCRDSIADDEDVKDSDILELVKCDDCGDMVRGGKSFENHRMRKQRCREPGCGAILCTKPQRISHRVNVHQKHEDKTKYFNCAVCKYSVNSKTRMLLHLIHHPNQSVDEGTFDLTILRKYGIMV